MTGPRRDPRVPLQLRIRLAPGSLDDFIERHALNVSRGGLFVRTLDPLPPGTPVRLDPSRSAEGAVRAALRRGALT